MRKTLGMLVTISALLLGLPQAAHSQCLFCGVIGFMLGSNSSASAADTVTQGVQGGGGYVLYQMSQEAKRRVKEPLESYSTLGGCYYYKEGVRGVPSLVNGVSWQQRFAISVRDEGQGDVKNFEVLQVSVVPTDPRSANCIILRFDYTKKDNFFSEDEMRLLVEKK